MAISTYNTKLLYGASESATTTQIIIKSFPSILGQRNSLETTTLSDDAQTYIPGIRQQAQTFDFTANWDKEVFETLYALTASQYWKFQFGDGSYFTWQGCVSVSNNEGGVDAVQEMTISVSPETVPEYNKGA